MAELEIGPSLVDTGIYFIKIYNFVSIKKLKKFEG